MRPEIIQWGRVGILVWAFALTGDASAATTINDTNRYAYGANVGWINWQGDRTNGALIGQSYCTGNVWSANCGWIGLGKGPTNGFQYGNASANDWGVNHDGAGHLRGFAYGANIGWLQFESNGNPRVDLLSGRLSGYVWGANVGWIGLSNNLAFVQTDRLGVGPDSDGDGIPDAWEYQQVGNLTNLTAGGDFDGDGVSDAKEYIGDTDADDSSQFLWITAEEVQSGGETSVVTWASEPTRLYHLQKTTVLTNFPTWTDSGLGVVSPDAGTETIRGTPSGHGTSHYFRVEATVPLVP